MTVLVDETQRQAYRERGFAVLPGVIDGDALTQLRQECAYFLGYTDAQMDARGVDVHGITHRGKRYFISGQYRRSRYLADFLFGDTMAAITRAFLGDSVHLFNEQWVVKGPEQGMEFAWHQDSGYVNFRDRGNQHPPYLTCWCALDDMRPDNGTISVLSHDVLGTRARILPHELQPGTNDLVGYRGDEPGECVELAAGGVAVFSSTTLHRSAANTTDRPRRAYLAQYCATPIVATDGDQWGQAVPFLIDGERVYDRSKDDRQRWVKTR